MNNKVNTSQLRKEVESALQLTENTITANHYLVGLNRLHRNGFLNKSINTDNAISVQHKKSEAFWSLTATGRMYAETQYSAELRPIRRYCKKRS